MTAEPIDIDAWRRNIRESTFSGYHYHMGMALRGKDDTASVESFKRALAVKSDFAGAVFRLIEVLRTIGKVSEADSTEKLAEGQDADYRARAQWDLGRMYTEVGEYDAAAESFRRVHDCTPVPAFVNSARFNADLQQARTGHASQMPEGEYDEAISLLREIVKTDAGNMAVNRALALRFLATSRFADAEACYQLIIKNNPSDLLQVSYFSLSLLGQGKLNDAIVILERGLAADPKNIPLKCNLGVVRLTSGDILGAETAFNDAVAIAGGDPAIKSFLGLALQERGRTEEAVELHIAAARAQPTFGLWPLHLALAYHRAGDETAMEENLGASLRLNPAWAGCWSRLYRWVGSSISDRLIAMGGR